MLTKSAPIAANTNRGVDALKSALQGCHPKHVCFLYAKHRGRVIENGIDYASDTCGIVITDKDVKAHNREKLRLLEQAFLKRHADYPALFSTLRLMALYPSRTAVVIQTTFSVQFT